MIRRMTIFLCWTWILTVKKPLWSTPSLPLYWQYVQVKLSRSTGPELHVYVEVHVYCPLPFFLQNRIASKCISWIYCLKQSKISLVINNVTSDLWLLLGAGLPVDINMILEVIPLLVMLCGYTFTKMYVRLCR